MALEIKNVAVIGCGWLGLPLSQMLIDDGYRVKGTTRSTSKRLELKKAGIEASILDIYDKDQDIEKTLGEVDAVVLNIPPGRKVEGVESLYPSGIERLIQKCPGLKNAYVVYISSTGVYPNTGALVDEISAVRTARPSGKALIAAEEVIKRLCHNYVLLRMSGLVGPDREPSRWFAGKSDMPGGDTPVNMVHLVDCLHIIQLMLEQQPHNEIYNVTAPEHPVRREFYKEQSEKFGLEPPTFLDGVVPHKKVDHEKLVKELGYQYSYPNPLRF